MKSRKKKSLPVRAKRYSRQQKLSQQLEYNSLEPRQLLATDFVGNLVNLENANGSDLIHLETPVPVSDSADLLRDRLNLGSNESVVLTETNTDRLGWTRYKYQQHIDGVPVEGSSYKLHAYGGEITMMSGDRVNVQNVVLGTQISPEAALQAALDHIGADTYEWQVATPLGEQLSPPTPEPVYLTNVEGESVVAYKMVVRAIEPAFSSDTVFVNANTGEVELVKSTIHDADEFAIGTLITFNQGRMDPVTNQPTNDLVLITADTNNGTNFTLQNEGGSLKLPGGVQQFLGGIETRNSQDNNNIFTTDNPVFANTEGSHLHYGAEQSLEYFWNTHFRLSYDDAGATVINNANLAIANAFWDGQSLSFGGGFGAIDVVGHEFTHGVVQFSANLVYQDEYGALNESFADIFGESVEEHAREEQGLGANQNDWLLGEEVAGRGAFRGFQFPNDFGDPSYYKGTDWKFGSADNGGVHSNSGVQNHWFYLLSEGTAGFPGGIYENEVGERYKFDGIGIEDASRVAYQNLTSYLSEFSEYQDAYEGAMQSTLDLFGRNSDAWEANRKAWNAVGFYGDRIVIDDIQEYLPGSVIYAAEGTTSPTNDEPVEFWINLEAGQTVSLVVAPNDFTNNMTVQVDTHDFAPTAPFDNNSGTLVLNEFPIVVSGQNVITVDGIPGREGQFDYRLVLNSELEIESVSDAVNESMADAQDISDGVYTVGDASGSATRFAVLGSFEADEVPTLDGDDFETGILDSDWTTSSTKGSGRVQVSDRFGTGVGGDDFALFMDTLGVENNLNEAIWSVDLASVAEPILSFGYVEFDDENTVLPDVFSNSRVGDGVSISNDGQIWHTILTDTETDSGIWHQFEINLKEFATNNNLDLGANFQVKFQQYDDGQITNGSTTDGRGFDNVKVVNGEPSEDWYSFDAVSEQVVSLTVGNPSGNETLKIDLYDSAGNLLLEGTGQANETNAISQYVISQTDTYFAKVTGQGLINYGLAVTVDADLDSGSTAESPQDIGIANAVMGSISAVKISGADPDAVEDFLPLDNAFEGVAFSDNVTGGSVYAALASFAAPTGTKVFATDVRNDDGWQEGINELRAEFDIGQTSVSLDFGSDDGGEDHGFMRAYDKDGFLLDEAFTDGIEPGKLETLTLSNRLGDIKYIIAGGVGTDITPIDNLVFDVVDETSDYYVFDATAGRALDIDVSFPGTPVDFSGFGDLGGRFPSQFINLLKFGTNINLRMELTELSSGNVVALGDEAIRYDVVTSGDYQLKVSADAGSGNYFIDINQTLGGTVDVGLTGDGIAISENATGTGYIMFSEARVHDRFSVNPPNSSNSDHLIAVRYNQELAVWQYNNDTAWHTFSTRANDRILAAVNFNSDEVVAYEGATGEVNGVEKGYFRSDLVFTPNVFGGAADANEISVEGTFFDTDAAVSIEAGSLNLGVAVVDDATGLGYFMHSLESVHTRFSDVAPSPDNSDHFIAVRFNGTNWEYNNNLVWVQFDPVASDRLIAAVDFDSSFVTPLKGVIGKVNGIEQGYVGSDIVFSPDMYGGTFNLGEYMMEGTYFEAVEDDAVLLPPTMGRGIAIADNASGTAYLMYSPLNVHARFAADAPFADNSDHLIAARFVVGRGWEYNDNFVWVAFDPTGGDRLLAHMDLSTKLITPLKGKTGELYGIPQGYDESDLVFHTNQWNGVSNYGEVQVDGTFFESRTSKGGIGSLGSGVAVTDNATGTGYFMFSDESVHTRFAADSPNSRAADHLIAVRYEAGSDTWEYNNALGWFVFTPVASDRLFASVDFDTKSVEMLEGLSGDIQGITAGYFDSDLTVESNRFDGKANFGEFMFSGSYLIENTATDRLTGPIGGGIAVADNTKGTGFIMYSAENLFERFSMNKPLASNSQHLIAVRYIASSGKWHYNNNRRWVAFEIAREDRMLATVDFDADSIVSLQGTNKVFQGALVGFASGDLTFSADTFDGASNDGEFTVGGTFFNA